MANLIPDLMVMESEDLEESKAAALDKTPAGNDPDEVFANWYLSQLEQIKHREDVIKEQTQRMLTNTRNQRAALEWRWGAEFRGVVDKKLREQGGKKRSYDFHMGRAGYRKTPGKLQIVDAEAAEKWAIDEKLWAAMKISLRITPMQEVFKLTGEVPNGTRWVEPVDTFYPKQEQLEPELLAMLEGGHEPIIND
jgi:hypothetical protein